MENSLHFAYLICVANNEKKHKSILTPLDAIYPECKVLINDSPQLYPLFCFDKDNCPRNSNCFETLAKRVNFVFHAFKDAKILVLYFAYRNEPDKLRGGVFYRDFVKPPKFIKINKSSLNILRKQGEIYKLELPSELFLPKPTPELIQIKGLSVK